MKILLAAKHTSEGPRPVGGVQTWIDTLRSEFVKKDGAVTLWARGQPEPEDRFDHGVVANIRRTKRLMKKCDRAFVVSHGVIGEERPSKNYPTAYTSEEVRDFWMRKASSPDGPIIRQPIDLDFWSPEEGAEGARGTLVHYGYYDPVKTHEAVAEALGLRPLRLSKDAPPRIRDILRGAGLVMASGRAACEAMACGAPVVICDNRSRYQEALLDPNIEAAMMRNYSGRGGVRPDVEPFLAAAKAALARGGAWHRVHAEKHHDAATIASQILEILHAL